MPEIEGMNEAQVVKYTIDQVFSEGFIDANDGQDGEGDGKVIAAMADHEDDHSDEPPATVTSEIDYTPTLKDKIADAHHSTYSHVHKELMLDDTIRREAYYERDTEAPPITEEELWHQREKLRFKNMERADKLDVEISIWEDGVLEVDGIDKKRGMEVRLFREWIFLPAHFARLCLVPLITPSLPLLLAPLLPAAHRQ